MLLWLDLETTDLDPKIGETLEIAAILTDDTLCELSRFHRVLHFEGEVSDFIRQLHTDNGLLAASASSTLTEKQGTADLHDWLLEFVADGSSVVLAGSGVAHFDFPWMKARQWDVASLLKYYVIDVGVLRRGLRLLNAEVVPDVPQSSGPQKVHRAMADVEAHLEEMRLLKTALGGDRYST